jgi:citrate lyase beta subunit
LFTIAGTRFTDRGFHFMESHGTSSVPPRLAASDVEAVDLLLADADAGLASAYPGDSGARQPVHTVYVPADRVTPDLTGRWGAQARAALDEHAASPAAMAAATGMDRTEVEEVWPLMLAKLAGEPVEDLRIDLEDGYGERSDDVEDHDVVAAVGAVADAVENGMPAFWGIRFKSFESSTRHRGLRTLDLALGAVLARGPLPDGWVVTLPKVTSVDQVVGMAETCERLERAYGLPAGRLRFEIQVETPQLILGADGRATVASAVHAARGRCSALHFGTYDYTAALGIAAGDQSMDHPAADHAKAVMALAAAGTGVRLADGSTNVLPVGDRAAVHSGWALHARLVRRSLTRGYYQGWDLHPAQLPSRYLATFAFFRRGLGDVMGRLAGYLGGVEGGVLDEPATAQALAGFLLRGAHCGAVGREEIVGTVGVDLDAVEALARRRVA